MHDVSKRCDIRLFIHLLLISADSQMRWIIGGVNTPQTGANPLAFGLHPIDV